MTRKKKNPLLNFLRDCDDMVHLITGQRIKPFVKRGVDLYGEDITRAAQKAILGNRDDVPPDYRLLHARPSNADIVIKGRFRALMRVLHPDTGTHPDSVEYQRVLEAYERIMAERNVGKSKA